MIQEMLSVPFTMQDVERFLGIRIMEGSRLWESLISMLYKRYSIIFLTLI